MHVALGEDVVPVRLRRARPGPAANRITVEAWAVLAGSRLTVFKTPSAAL